MELITWSPDNPLALAPPETLKANAALNDYALLGSGRSLSKLVEVYRSRPEGGPTTKLSTLKDWSGKYDWQARIARYDAAVQAEARAALEAQWLQRRAAERLDTFALGQELIGRAREMLKFPLAEIETSRERRVAEDGTTVIEIVTVVQPARWSLRDIARLADIGVKLERLALGEATERVAVDGTITINLTAEQIDQLAPDEVDLVLAYLDIPTAQRASSPLHQSVAAIFARLQRT